MGRGRPGSGVEARESHIRVRFTYDGKRCYEPIELPPTPPNLRYAAKLVETIRKRVDAGTFDYAEFFPTSKRSSVSGGRSIKHYGDLWLKSKGRCADATRSQYNNALKFWYEELGETTDVTRVAHSTLAALIGAHPWASNKLHNNYMIPLRGLFAFAARDLKIQNPVEGVDNAKVQKKAPDPFTREEMERILADMVDHYDLRVWAYYAFAFSTGERPEEIIAERWDDLDQANSTARVERARSFRGKVKPIKTYQERDVDLLKRAISAIDTMKRYTFTKAEGYVFENPVTCKPWHDERAQRDNYWKPTLKRLGIRYRAPYQTRHTYATLALMSGANPSYISRQMGHRSAKMLFETYAKWIDGADRGREKAKVEAALESEFGPNLAPGKKFVGRRDWIRSNILPLPQRVKAK